MLFGMVDSGAMERYLGRCNAVLINLTEMVSSEGLAEAQHLIDHGEPAEGLCSLAWYLSEHGVRVPAAQIATIRELTAEFVLPEHMPPNLDDLAIPE